MLLRMDCHEIPLIVKKLKMENLWGKDYIKEGYSSDIFIKHPESKNERPLFNWAYYLIPEEVIFPLHKLLSDESWQYCLGGPLNLFFIEEKKIKTITLGPDIFNGEELLHIVPRNTWFAATPVKGSKFTLVTHCVSPGWHPNDDIAGFYEDMIKLAPEVPAEIKRLSWPKDRKIYSSHKTYKNWKR